MKKNGFTLAEILISMAIIGTVAAVTIPTLNINANENANIAKYKKTIAALNNIGAMAVTNSKIDFSSVNTGSPTDANRGDDAEGELREQLWAILDRYGNVDQRATAAGRNPGGGCADASGVVYFKDGTALCYIVRTVVANDPNMLSYIRCVVDVNGIKQPNMMSSCDDANCNSRNIRDQFMITLASDMAFPGRISSLDERTMNPSYEAVSATEVTWNNAAIWAFEK